MSDTILVTGASGNLGRLVLDHLLASGKVSPGKIIAVSRDPAKLGAYAEKGVVTRSGDFDNPASLDEAFQGAGKILLISTDALGEPGKRLAQHTVAVAAAKKAGAARIFYTSLPNAGTSVVTFAPDHLGTEEAIKASGLSYTILRNSWYMENLFMSLPHALQAGQWYTSAGNGRNPYIARDDIAAAIAGALLADETENRIYTLTGPAALTNAEIAAMATAVSGKPLAVVDVTDEQLAGGLKGAGLPEAFIPTLVSFDTNARQGLFDIVTSDAETLSGRKLKPLQTFFEENSAALEG